VNSKRNPRKWVVNNRGFYISHVNAGRGVALNAAGNIVALGAYQNNANAGHARVFRFDAARSSMNPWIPLGQAIAGLAWGEEKF